MEEYREQLLKQHAFELEIYQAFIEVTRSDLPRLLRDHAILNLKFALMHMPVVAPAGPGPMSGEGPPP